ncbi:MAG: MATE family efflux transporter [Clostridia bacterium]|nr:MATE family efflux transporter [Clostridia bacterium]
MIKRLVRQMLTAQILSALTVSLCLLIDNIMIGRFLGERALTAYGLANPVLLIIGAVGSMLCAGVQVACGKSLGRGDREETNAGYSSAVAVAAVFSLAFTLLALLFRVPVSRLLGANEPALLEDTSRYMAGFSIGAPASMGALILVPFLQMAGQSNLLIAAVLGMTVADVGLDLLNVLVFHGGMFGMGLASALSYYIAMLIGGGYFLSKKCVFAFSAKQIRWAKIRELLAGGVPTVFGMASSVALIFAVNRILLDAGGKAAVAAFSVVNTLINASNCISTGSGGVALTLSGVFYNEEDRSALSELLRLLSRAAIALGVVVMGLLLAFANPLVRLFIPYAGESQAMAARGLRTFSTGLAFCCLTNVLRSSYQGTGRVHRMEAISVLDNAVLPILAALAFSRIAGVNGAWFLFLAAEALTTLGILACVWLEKRRVTLRAEDVLLLRDSFGVPESDRLEANLRDLDGVMEFSRSAADFCRAHGGGERLAAHLALCVEEMGTNIVAHGFAPDGRSNLSIRLQVKNGHWTLRFRDDCFAFDPVSHVSEAGAPDESVGIRLAMRMADEARYTYSMNLNNLTLILRQAA